MAYRTKTLYSGTKTGGQSGASLGEEVNLGEMMAGTAILAITAVGSGDAGDTLEVWLQGSFDGTTYFDIVAFPVRAVSDGTGTRIAAFNSTEISVPEEAIKTAALAAGTVSNRPWGDRLRAWYKVTDADNDSSWTFNVKVHLVG